MTPRNAQRIADVIAMVTFSYITGMAIEVGIAKMTWSQSFFSRNASIPLNMLTARPFGVFRNFLLKKFSAQSRRGRTVIDLVAFISFQIPIYVIVLSFSGANLQQIITAISSVIVLFSFMGLPYGLWLDLCRSVTARWSDDEVKAQ